MPKRSSKKKAQEAEEAPGADAALAAEVAPADDGKNPAAVLLGRLGGRKGGPARAQKLTKEQRTEIARKAAQARWAKKAD